MAEAACRQNPRFMECRWQRGKKGREPNFLFLFGVALVVRVRNSRFGEEEEEEEEEGAEDEDDLVPETKRGKEGTWWTHFEVSFLHPNPRRPREEEHKSELILLESTKKENKKREGKGRGAIFR